MTEPSQSVRLQSWGLSLGGIVTLIGLLLVALGAALPWGQAEFEGLPIGALPVYVSPSAPLRTGFAVKIGWMSAGWLVVTLAVICAALLLFAPNEKERAHLFRIQTACAAGILVVVLLHAGLYAGILLTGLGACTLIAGAIARYR